MVDYEGRPIPATAGQRLLDVILAAGIDHRHICGGNGFCTSCRIEVLDGAAHLTPTSALERERLGREAGSLRLACQTRVNGPASIRPARPRTSGFGPDDE